MADIQKGFTFIDGGTGTAANLHTLIESATILPAFISAKTLVTPTSADAFLLHQASSSALRRCTLAGVISAIPQGGAGTQFALRKLGTTATDAAAGNDARFPTVLTGVRHGNGVAPDSVATPRQLTFPAHNLSGGTLINWDLADVFYDTLTSNKTYTFSNSLAIEGRMITVVLKLQGFTPTWPPLLGAIPATVGSATVHYFTFIRTPLGISGIVVAV